MIDTKRLRELANAATPGEWTWERADEEPDCMHALRGGDESNVLPTTVGYGNIHVDGPDAAFIAAARTALPELLDELDRLRVRVAAHEAALRAIRDDRYQDDNGNTISYRDSVMHMRDIAECALADGGE